MTTQVLVFGNPYKLIRDIDAIESAFVCFGVPSFLVGHFGLLPIPVRWSLTALICCR